MLHTILIVYGNLGDVHVHSPVHGRNKKIGCNGLMDSVFTSNFLS